MTGIKIRIVLCSFCFLLFIGCTNRQPDIGLQKTETVPAVYDLSNSIWDYCWQERYAAAGDDQYNRRKPPPWPGRSSEDIKRIISLFNEFELQNQKDYDKILSEN